MKIKYVLFDLDGTLLPMDQDLFTKLYFSSLAKKMTARGYEPNKLIESIWTGTKSMIKNDGNKSNEQVFWQTFCNIYGDAAKNDIPYFNEFYKTDFNSVKNACGFNKQAKEVVDLLKSKNIKIALATNPIFPKIATLNRINWAGLNPDDFELITTYENSYYCKPNLNYYKAILNQLNALPNECLMVGNDISEDMIANSLGMKTFLLTDCLINKNNENISIYNHGSFEDLINFINQNT